MTSTTMVRHHAAQALRRSNLPFLRKLTVEETEERVIITGSVSTYYQKQLAQETLMPILGQRELLNHVTVNRS